MSSVFEISVEISRPLLQVIKPFDTASGAKDVAGFLITDGANKSPINCDNRIVERGAFGLVVENGNQCGRVDNDHRGKPKSSYPMISSADRGSTIGRAALRTAIASIAATSSASVMFAGGGVTELRHVNTSPERASASRKISSGVRPVDAAFALTIASIS